jgi:CHAT domain-containing protein
LQRNFAADFPDYAAPSNPLPLTLKEIQALLSADEAMLLFSVADEESYVFALTDERFDWKSLPIGSEMLAQEIAAFRRGLDVGSISQATDPPDHAGLFDLALANELYATLLGPVETLVKDKRSLQVVPAGALTALPFQLLLTEKPLAAVPDRLEGYRDAAWLLKRQAVSVLPSVASLKALRTFARKDRSTKPMIGFGDPVFKPLQDTTTNKRADMMSGTAKSAARSLVAGAYADIWQGAGVDRDKLAQVLPQLPDTADELNAIAHSLGVAASDIHLGADARETTVKRSPLADYGIVHFATHGLVAGDVKGLAEPSLALSIPRQPSDLDDGCSRQVRSRSSNSTPTGSSCRPAIPSPATSLAPRRCRAWRALLCGSPRAIGFALGGCFGSRDLAHHRNLRSSQIRSRDRPRRGAASGDAWLSQRCVILEACLPRVLGPIRTDRRGGGTLNPCDLCCASQ